MGASTQDAAAAVRSAVGWLADALEAAPDDAWDRPAGTLEWTCRRTVGHLLDDLVAYALQVTAARHGDAQDDYLPVVPPRGGEDLVAVDPDTGTAGVVTSLRAFGELFAGALDGMEPQTRAFHPWGLTDRSGYAAVGLLEVLVHGYDLLSGFDLPAEPPAAPSRLVVQRLFPDGPDGEPAAVLLWCTGRLDLPREGDLPLPRPSRWLPDASVRD